MTLLPAGTPAPWWQAAVIYQIYPRSFADGNGDGMGDLPGITGKVDYLASLGVDALWLSPFYLSPQADAGYDVADYRQVDPRFGTMADFDALLAAATGRGLRVIVDLVPNHTSDEHAWFDAARRAAPGSPERARYIFRDGRGPGGDEPPNNWKSVFGGPAWTRVSDDGRPGQWYLHLFDTKQPDLNWEHQQVRDELDAVLRFWLDKGVAGFRVDVAHGLVKAPGLPDWDGRAAMVEGTSATPDARAVDPGSASLPEDTPARRPTPNMYTSSPFFDQDGVHEIYRAWHKVLQEYDGDRMLVAEAWVEPAERLARYVRPDEMQQAFNFEFLLAGWDAGRMAAAIRDSLAANAAVGAPATWVLSNHDTVRHPTRFGLADPTGFPKGLRAEDEQPDEALGLARARAATMIMLGLPGSAYLYQGEELGLPEHTGLHPSMRQDPSFFRTGGEEPGRDGCRVPLPWQADAPGYGFSTGCPDPAAPWLPQPESFARYAEDRQEGVPGSTLELYRELLRLRSALGLGTGTFDWDRLNDPRKGVLAFRNGDLLVLVNLGTDPIALPDAGTVLLSSAAGADLAGLLPPDTAAWLR